MIFEETNMLINICMIQSNPSTYTNFRNLVEGEIYRNFHIYANEFSEFTYTKVLPGEKKESRD